MDPLVERANFGIARENQRRDGGSRLDVLAPTLDDLGYGPWAVGVGAKLVTAAMLARLKMRREGCRIEDLGFHLEHEVSDFGWPDARFDRFGANVIALADVLVGPDVDDLVQRAHFGSPEAVQPRELDATGNGDGERLFGLGHCARLQQVGAHLENHGCPPSVPLAAVGEKFTRKLIVSEINKMLDGGMPDLAVASAADACGVCRLLQ